MDNKIAIQHNGYGMGLLKDKPDRRDFRMAKILKDVQLPPNISYRTRYPKVRNQGSRGSCVAHAACSVKEYQELLQRRFKAPFDLSEEWVYEQIREPGGGAYPRNAFDLLVKVGVPREKFMPYDPNKSDDAPRDFKPSKAAIYNAKFYKASGYARLDTVYSMQQSLVSNGPFMAGVDWYSGWFNPRGEEIEGMPVLRLRQGNIVGGHAFGVVGYITVGDKVYFIMRNSWDTDWADGGYALMEANIMAENAWDMWASFDIRNSLIDQEQVAELTRYKDFTPAP